MRFRSLQLTNPLNSIKIEINIKSCKIQLRNLNDSFGA